MRLDARRLQSVLHDMKNSRRVTRSEIQVRHDIPRVTAYPCSNGLSRSLRKADIAGPANGPPAPAKSVAFLHRSCNLRCSILLLIGRSSEFVRGIAVVVRANEGQNFP